MRASACKRWDEGTLEWWPGTESNRRRQPFQGCALPLSYLAVTGEVSVYQRVSAANCALNVPYGTSARRRLSLVYSV